MRKIITNKKFINIFALFAALKLSVTVAQTVIATIYHEGAAKSHCCRLEESRWLSYVSYLILFYCCLLLLYCTFLFLVITCCVNNYLAILYVNNHGNKYFELNISLEGLTE